MIITSEIISLGAEVEVQMFRSIALVPTVWDDLAPPRNLFLQRTYLEVLENFPPAEMQFAYLIFFKNKEPVGIAIGQIQLFRARQNIQEEKEEAGFMGKIGSFVKDRVADKISFYTLVCGNLLLTGEHGFYFLKNSSTTKKIALLYAGLNAVLPLLDKQGIECSAILIKEIPEEKKSGIGLALRQHYQEFTMQPNMVLTLEESWQNFSDYTNGISSKYRVRMKRAFKKATAIRKENLDLAAIVKNQKKIHQLYLDVANNSDFNSAELHPHYFPELKRALPAAFQLTGYYVEDQLIGYYTTIKNHEELEAHFLGFDYEKNMLHQTYLNILFDIIKDGISADVKKIIFARTALEIKSSIGAVPEEMYFYARHRSRFSNRLLQSMVEYLQPKSPEWKQRHPFKS